MSGNNEGECLLPGTKGLKWSCQCLSGLVEELICPLVSEHHGILNCRHHPVEVFLLAIQQWPVHLEQSLLF